MQFESIEEAHVAFSLGRLTFRCLVWAKAQVARLWRHITSGMGLFDI